MTSGNVQLGPDPDRILEALKALLREDPGAQQHAAEEDSLQADEVSGEGDPT
jgi:hypothetical protein